MLEGSIKPAGAVGRRQRTVTEWLFRDPCLTCASKGMISALQQRAREAIYEAFKDSISAFADLESEVCASCGGKGYLEVWDTVDSEGVRRSW